MSKVSLSWHRTRSNAHDIMFFPFPRIIVRGAMLLLGIIPALVLGLGPSSASAWSEPHNAITKAAVEVLPAWQHDWLGDELIKLGDSYCLIPDEVFTNRPNARFAMMDSQPGVTYLQRLHLPLPQQAENLETLRYFMDKAVTALRAGDNESAAKFMGTVCHTLEDFGSPAHTVPGDNMFTLLQQFLPSTEPMKDQLLHSPIESGKLDVHVPGYRPRLLGTSVEEASWRLLHRVHEGIINARSTTIPIIQALYAEDYAAVAAGQMKAAKFDAEVVADAVYTILCLGAEKFDPNERGQLQVVPIGAMFPTEAVNLFYPQTHFFSSPNWGHARSGVILAQGKYAMPLKLRISTNGGVVEEKEFANGISSGVGKPLTYLLPKGVYQRFTVYAGLHPELGAEGKVEFTVLGDGKPLATATVSGTEPAHAFDCNLAGISEIQLVTTGRSPDPKKNYAIWADPTLRLKRD